jgi:hypothetical protein
MEPILELATRITTQLWFLHARYPEDESLDGIAAKRDLREKCEARDYSNLQDLLDLAGLESHGDWDPNDPLGDFRETDIEPKPQYAQFRGWAPKKLYESYMEFIDAYRVVEKNRQAWLDSSDEFKIKVTSDAALDVVFRRIRVLQEQGLLSAVTFCPRALAVDSQAEDGPASDRKASRNPERLTREELYENVTSWLLGGGSRENILGLAKEFIPDGRFFIEEAIDSRVKELETFPENSPMWKLAHAWTRMRNDKTKNDRVMRLLLNSQRLRALCRHMGVAVPFSMVYRAELDEIARSRLVRLRSTLNPDNMSLKDIRSSSGLKETSCTPQRQAFDAGLFGLALSGGGIRSATFALGILQGMADRNILPYIDILSTVSGGGYIGSWMISWIKRRGSVNSVQESMRGNATSLRLGDDCADRNTPRSSNVEVKPFGWITRNSDPHADHVRPIRLLRQYSRYLAPQAGLFSADTWTIAATWVRNSILNFTVLISLFGAVLLLPRMVIFLMLHLRLFAENSFVRASGGLVGFLLLVLIGGLPLLWACYLIGADNLKTFGPYRRDSKAPRGYDDSQVVSRILLLIVIGAFLETTILWYSGSAEVEQRDAVAAFALVIMLGIALLAILRNEHAERSNEWLPRIDRILGPQVWRIAFLGSILTGACLFCGLYSLLHIFGDNTERGLWISASAGLALMLTVIGSVLLMFIGLFGKDLSDEQREWWSRLGAWLALAITGWLTICAICFFMPLWIAKLGLKVAAAGGVSWLAITGAGAKLAFSPRSGRDGEEGTQSRLNQIVLSLAPSVFIIGLLSAVSFGLFWAVEAAGRIPLLVDSRVAQHCCTGDWFSFERMVDQYWSLLYPGSLAPLCLIASLGFVCLLMAWRVDINEFSMHNFYKNRLVRAYLGASRARSHRAPSAFTGFDLEDDIRLSRFQYSDPTQPRDMVIGCKPSYAGPFPIINTALNITQGADLGLQERKAESFIFTPLWSGFDFSRRQATVKKTNLSEYAFQRTERFADPQYHGAFLGTAMAISGAAFNSNAGFHTSPALAFLLTVFGVRLGWWAGNPRGKRWTSPSPGLGLLYLIKELTARTDSSSEFVLLSDGGHFENMGLYELIRRRCRYIVLSDAEEDEKFKLEGIGGAVRKCREDFGVVVDLNLEALQPIGDPAASKLHYSIGTIIYPGQEDCGKLVYIKSSVTGDEPVDVAEFRKRHSEFPHTSTVNQFFDESHFESYRALGHHVAQDVFQHDMGAIPIQPGNEIGEAIAGLFKNIETSWEARLASSKKKLEVSISVAENDQPRKEQPDEMDFW